MKRNERIGEGEQTLRRRYIRETESFLARHWGDPRALWPRHPSSPSGSVRRPAKGPRS